MERIPAYVAKSEPEALKARLTELWGMVKDRDFKREVGGKSMVQMFYERALASNNPEKLRSSITYLEHVEASTKPFPSGTKTLKEPPMKK